MQADFDSLIDLITTTISPESWDDVGGPGSIGEFAGGVYVDPAGLLKKFAAGDRPLARRGPPRRGRACSRPAIRARSAVLRKVSLTRLEREVQLLHALGREPDEAMQTLAGLQRIKYVLFYPETGDIVLAGPAGDWRRDARRPRSSMRKRAAPSSISTTWSSMLRNAHERRSAVRLLDHADAQGDLAAAQAVNDKWSAKSLRPGQRDKWLGELRAAVGQQDIEVYGIDPRTRAARVIVEADYRMKLVGMGLEEGTLGVTSYLDSIELAKGEAPPPMSVLRWWFTLNYDALSGTPSATLRDSRPGRESAQRERAPDRARRARAHRQERRAERPLRRVVHQAFRDAGRQVSGLCRPAEHLRPGPRRRRDPEPRPARPGRLAHDALRPRGEV